MNPIEISPEQFKSLCEQFLAIASDYLKEMDFRSIPPKGSGAEIDRIFRAPLPETGLADEALRAREDLSTRLTNEFSVSAAEVLKAVYSHFCGLAEP
jgi:hypothetical protein